MSHSAGHHSAGHASASRSSTGLGYPYRSKPNPDRSKPGQARPLGCRSWARCKPSTPRRPQARAGAPRAAPKWSSAVESAALEAAGSNTRGGGWAPSGRASGSECLEPPGTARRALRRRTRRARALRRQHVDRAAAPRPRREAPSRVWASTAQARRSTRSGRASIEVPRTSRGCARPRLAAAALAPGLQPARRARPLCLQLRGVRAARRDAFARGRVLQVCRGAKTCGHSHKA